jgi:RNA polymerase sigma-70 factor, ECF subfamily
MRCGPNRTMPVGDVTADSRAAPSGVITCAMEATAKKLTLPPSFEEALRRHEHEIMRFLLRMTRDRNDALDLFQETWLRAYRAYPKLDSEQGVRPWLYRIATNLCRNRARDNLRRARVMSNGADPTDSDHHFASASDSASAAGSGGGPEGMLHLRRAIAGLPHKQGQALVMRKFAGLEYEEIGAELKCSADSARASVYQALKKLKAIR